METALLQWQDRSVNLKLLFIYNMEALFCLFALLINNVLCGVVHFYDNLLFGGLIYYDIHV